MSASNAPLMLSVSGCRGIIGESLTPEVASRFAGAFASVLRERAKGPFRVVVGRDGRAGCQMVHQAALAGLVGAGANVIDLGVATTPTTAVMTDDHRALGGMVITASHNPQIWSGLKCLLGGDLDRYGSAACAPPASMANQIIDRFRSSTGTSRPWNEIGTLESDDSAVERHIDRVAMAMDEHFGIDLAELGGDMGVALDSVNASGCVAGRAMLEALACQEILHIGGEPTGIFPHAPEPVKENLTDLCASVREIKAAAGFAQDPDADRLAIVDDRAEYIGEEYTLALTTLAVLEGMKRKGEKTQGAPIVTNLSTSRMLDDVAARYGARVLRTPVGEAHVVEAMKREGAPVGGEGNGGVIWPRTCYVRDSLAGMALTLWLIKVLGKPLSEIVAEIPAYAIEKRKVNLARKEDANPAIEKIAQAYKSQRVDLQDGVRIDFESKRAWLHVRASNTEPIMRLIAEAPEASVARQILDEASKVIG